MHDIAKFQATYGAVFRPSCPAGESAGAASSAAVLSISGYHEGMWGKMGRHPNS